MPDVLYSGVQAKGLRIGRVATVAYPRLYQSPSKHWGVWHSIATRIMADAIRGISAIGVMAAHKVARLSALQPSALLHRQVPELANSTGQPQQRSAFPAAPSDAYCRSVNISVTAAVVVVLAELHLLAIYSKFCL